MIVINIIVAVLKEKASIRFEQMSKIAFPWRLEECVAGII